MVCLKCSRMLYDHKGRIGRRSALELEFAHHTKDSDLASSATVRPSCPLCYVVWTSTRVYDKKILAGTKVDGVRKFLRATLKCVRPRLDGHPERRALYRLDFHLEGVKDAVASFVLEETGGGSPANAGNDPDDLPQGPVDRPVIARGPETESTSSSSIQAKAKEWIEQCALNHEACASASGPAFYPTRLLDLREILKYRQDDGELPGDSDDLPPFRRSPTTPMGTILESRAKQQKLAESDESTRKVYVVSKKNLAGEQKLGPSPFKGPYVTLSHCWGKLELKKLTENTRQEWFQYGVPVLELPLTFQHAIQFACSLGVRWLWIDALCIIQDSKDKEDWLVESSQMREVYANSYCNISATAASDASEGLFYKRDTTISWVDTVNIRVNGLQGTVKDEQTGKAKKWVECTIHDLSFWRDTVENAPVNKRSWVFQERLLAPRVIHWCRDQIAFECREADKAECRPDGLPHYQIRADEIIEETRLKCLDVKTGKRLRNLRLRGKRSKSAPVGDKFYLYEIWKRLVETYSRMQLSYEGDRLVALSGIASMMTSVLKSHGIEDQYIAGMWRNHMAIQLLWYVNEGNGQTRQPFENTRPKAYRAPTFSWASVETERGITFPETTNNEELLVRVEIMRLTYKRNDNMFGLLTDGYVVLRGVLRKIDLIDKAASLRVFIKSADLMTGTMIAFGAGVIPVLANMAISAVYRQEPPWPIMATWMIFCAILSVSLVVLRFFFLENVFKWKSSGKIYGHQGANRYRWRLLKDGERVGPSHETMWLDSPVTPPVVLGKNSSVYCGPSIFGRKSSVYCVPAVRDNEYLTCLLLQAVLDGDYGVRYRRIGLAKIDMMFKDDITDIITSPGKADTDLGRYYYSPDGTSADDSKTTGAEKTAGDSVDGETRGNGNTQGASTTEADSTAGELRESSKTRGNTDAGEGSKTGGDSTICII